MSEEKGYQGWANYPTWAVNLWLANDEGLYREALDRVAGECEDAAWASQVEQGVWTVEESRRYHVADALKGWVRNELAPDLGASFAADLLGFALDQVDWYELADAWIKSVREEVGA